MANSDIDTAELRPDRPAPMPASAPTIAPTLNQRYAPLPLSLQKPTVPGYEILGELGRGGMGVVYKATQAGLQRTVALKMVLSAAHATREDLQRFLDEATAIARLAHPHIVQIHEVGVAEDRPFFSMEYLDGGNLASHLAAGLPPPQAAAQLVETLARAIHFAHRQGIVHRDLKPANILLKQAETDSGKEPGSPPLASLLPKITDFGLAKQLDGSGLHTQTGIIMGTPSYMAPEQALARASAIGPLTDVYGLGTILYELLTGQAPFHGATELETIQQVIDREPTLPSRLRPTVPRDLETICLKCLRKEPAQRYPSAAALADDLQRFQNGEPILARPIGQLARLGRWCRRKPVIAALSAALIVLFVSGLPLVTALWLEARDNLDLAQRRQTEAESKEREARTQEGLAKHYAAEARQEGKKAEDRAVALKRVLQEVQQRRVKEQQQIVRFQLASGTRRLAADDWHGAAAWFTAALARELEVDDGAGQRARLEAHQLRLTGLRRYSPRLVELWSHAQGDVALAYHVGSGWLLTADARGHARVWNIRTGQQIAPALLPHGDAIEHACFSAARGDRILTFSRQGPHKTGTLRIWETATGKDLTPAALAPGAAVLAKILGGPLLSPEGRRLALATLHGPRLLDATSGAPIPLAGQEFDGYGEVYFSPDGRYLAATSHNFHTWVWDTTTGQKLQNAPIEQDAEQSLLVFSPDNQRLLATGKIHVGTLHALPPGPGPLHEFGHNGRVRSAVFRHDGRWVATASADGFARVLDTATHKLVGQLEHGSALTQIQLSPDGRWLLTAGEDATVRLWDVAEQRSVMPALKHSAALRFAALQPDGRHLTTIAADGTVRIWDLAVPGPDVTFQGHDGDVHWAAFSPDGRRVVTTSADQTARIWVAATGQPLAPPLRHPARIAHADLSLDNRYLVTTCARSAWLWNAHTGHLEKTLGRELANFQGVARSAFSPDSRYLLVAYVDRLNVHDLAQRRDIATVRQPYGLQVKHTVCSRDGRWVATVDNHTKVMLWDVTHNRAGQHLEHGHVVHAFAFSADSRWLVTGCGDRSARLWDAATGKLQQTLLHSSAVHWVVFSPDGGAVATISQDGAARVWDVATGKPRTPPLHTGAAIVTGAFSPDSQKLATGDADGGVWIWDAASGAPLQPPYRHPRGIATLAFSPDSRQILTTCGDGAARLWRLVQAETHTVEDLQLLTRALTGHRFDADEEAQVPLPSAETPELWRALRARFPGMVQVDDAAARSWRERQLLECQVGRQWPAVLWHCAQLLSVEPTNERWLQCRVDAFAELERWPEAVEAMLQLAPTSPAIARKHALVWLGSGHKQQYGQACMSLLSQPATKRERHTAVEAVRLSLAAEHPTKIELGLQWNVLHAEIGKPQDPTTMGILGCADYRTGNDRMALIRLSQVVKQPLRDNDVRDLLFLAMTLQRSNQAEAARQQLREAIQQLEQLEPQHWPWDVRLQWRLLRREAEVLIHGK